MLHYLMLGLIWLGVLFGGNLLAILAAVEMAEADEQRRKPPRGGHRVPVIVPMAA